MLPKQQTSSLGAHRGRGITGGWILLVLLASSLQSTPASEPALSFTAASSSRVEINQAFNGLTNLTLSVWIKTGTIPANYGAIAGRGHLQGANGFGLFSTSGGTLVFQTRYSETVVQASANYGFDGEWHHIAGVRNGTNTLLYIDGSIAATAGGALSSLDSSYKFGLGARDSGSWDFFFTGLMTEVRLWNYARSANVIQSDMNRRLTGQETGLIGYWSLKEGQGTVATDQAEPGYDGELVNTIWTNSETLTLLDWVLKQPLTGSRRFTNTNTLNVARFPYWASNNVYQFTDGGTPPNPESWLSTATPPATVTFTQPSADTNITLTAWMTNTTDSSSALVRIPVSIIYTPVKPNLLANGSLSRSFVEGLSSVNLAFSDIDAGSSGGSWTGGPIPLYSSHLFCAQDTTPASTTVTLTNAGVFDVVLTLTNEAGNVAVATCQVTVVERSELALYVSAKGDNSSGVDWYSALTSLQQAIDQSVPGDTIYVCTNTFLITNSIIILNHPDLTIRGGYVGIGSPGTTGTMATTICRDTNGPWVRLLEIQASTVTVDNIEFRNGRLRPESNRLGAGLFIAESSSVSMHRCVIADCILPALNSAMSRGAGVYVAGSYLEITDSKIYSNRMDGGSWAYEAPHGAGLAAVNTTLVMSNVFIATNINVFNHGPGRGGGLYLLNGQATLTGCTLVGNQVYYNRWPMYHHMGGGLYAENVAPLIITGCWFSGGQVRFDVNKPSNGGDALYLSGANLRASISDTFIVSNGVPISNQVANAVVVTDRARVNFNRVWLINNWGNGIEIGRAHVGTVALMTNVLVAGHNGHGIVALQGTNILNNVTLANNSGWGATNWMASGWVRNSIVWGNAEGSLSGWSAVNYSCIAGGHAGIDIADEDPIFGNPAGRDYHLQSRSGRWIPATQSWYGDAVSSPSLNLGDPDDPRWQGEPSPNGHRLNPGAYGGTAEASKFIVANGAIWVLF